ncbi:hypothetical protein [Maribacter ulvicola]|uniref:Uncharacterized protein n=1 Tax=Maribacter ulvicola TaxID=228959 RepID=A0A1N6WK06_9FLAO|nr:hypothetical protein [Maribacter ulvicola]SIQ90395.1 hypothetical protein SAMN05421797_104116 [Maribacter ulvicola]
MNNLQYARVGAVRSKDSYDQATNVQDSNSSSSGAFKSQEATLHNNHLNNISCK